MSLSWNEVRARAAVFAAEWSNAVRETSIYSCSTKSYQCSFRLQCK